MYYCGKDLNLREYMEERKKEYLSGNHSEKWEESENYIWAAQEYLSSMGEFSDEDRAFLQETDPELLDLEEDCQ